MSDFDRADQVITLVEIKYSSHSFKLAKYDFEQLVEKSNKFILYTKAKKSVNLALVVNADYIENTYTRELAKVVKMEEGLN